MTSINSLHLQNGDILFQGMDDNLTSSLLTHAAVFGGWNPAKNPMIFDITGYGFVKQRAAMDPDLDWYAFRCNNQALGIKVCVIANCWITSCTNTIHYTEEQDDDGFIVAQSKNVYSTSSVLTSYIGSSYYGRKAIRHAKYLATKCLVVRPKQLDAFKSRWFTGTICSYLPIALYQAAAGPAASHYYMAVDPRKSLPRDLAKFLTSSPRWEFLGNVENG